MIDNIVLVSGFALGLFVGSVASLINFIISAFAALMLGR